MTHHDLPDSPVQRVATRLTRRAIITLAGLLTGVRAQWSGPKPVGEPTVYFANHSSHGDFVLVWATLPAELRKVTRPVAGMDYWMASAVRRFLGQRVFNALMVRRDGIVEGIHPIEQMVATLRAGDSLIFFPEGKRNTGEDTMLPLRSGLFHIASQCPEVRLVPVWIENLRRVLPKGSLVPIPLTCSVHYGAPISLTADESKDAFLNRARQAMLDLRPEHDKSNHLREST